MLAGISAEIGDAPAIRVERGLFNGLGNGGDRLTLHAPGGAILDALSYGSDASVDQPALPAPGEGESLRRHFADDGSLLAVEVSGEPSPGRLEAPATPQEATGTVVVRGNAAAAAPTQPAADPPVEVLDDGSSTNRLAWAVLIALAIGALGGVAAYRIRERLGGG